MRILAVIINLLLLVPAALAQGDSPLGADSFRPVDTLGLQGRIVFSATDGASDKILVYDLNSKTVKVLVDGPGRNFRPAVSPGGALIAFVSDRDGSREIYITNWNGEGARRVTHSSSTGSNDYPTWLPDSSGVLYATTKSGATNIAVASPTGDLHAAITHLSGRNYAPTVSPNGINIAYVTDHEWPGDDICIWDRRAKSSRCVLTGSETFARPAWSTHGDLLAFAAGPVSPENYEVLDLKTNYRKPIYDSTRSQYAVTWTSDDRYILLSADDSTSGSYVIVATTLNTVPLVLLRSTAKITHISYSPVKTSTLDAQHEASQTPEPLAPAIPDSLNFKP